MSLAESYFNYTYRINFGLLAYPTRSVSLFREKGQNTIVFSIFITFESLKFTAEDASCPKLLCNVVRASPTGLLRRLLTKDAILCCQ